MSNPLLFARIQNLQAADPRLNLTKFIRTFDFQQIYSWSMLNLIFRGRRQTKNRQLTTIFENALMIYEQNQPDYREITPQTMRAARDHYAKLHGQVYAQPNKLMEIIMQPATVIEQAMQQPDPNNTLTCDLYDYFNLDLLHYGHPTAQSLFMNLTSYHQLQAVLMRVQLGDGLRFKELGQIAHDAQINLDQLRHLERACHRPEQYLQVYQALAHQIQPYAITN